jgi:Icc-related predicted phosphoesterase
MSNVKEVVRVAAVGDIHVTKAGQGSLLKLFSQVNEAADVLVLCGDLTDHGLPDEARALAKELGGFKLPMVGVLGNHDYESGRVDELKTIFNESRIHILDGDAIEIRGVGFGGVKGFCGGFGRRALGPWGETAIKDFVREALDEALKLETALSKLRSERRMAILHYAPIQATVEGEPPEIWPFLGSTRLEDPINRHSVDVVVHGHAHHGCPEGKTMSGIPVYNVSITLLQHAYPDRPPFRMIELPLNAKQAEQRAADPMAQMA